jgi:hypothetical protein
VAIRMNKRREGGKVPVPPGPTVRARQVASESSTQEDGVSMTGSWAGHMAWPRP